MSTHKIARALLCTRVCHQTVGGALSQGALVGLTVGATEPAHAPSSPNKRMSFKEKVSLTAPFIGPSVSQQYLSFSHCCAHVNRCCLFTHNVHVSESKFPQLQLLVAPSVCALDVTRLKSIISACCYCCDLFLTNFTCCCCTLALY